MDANALYEGIRLALAPVFLLTGVASLIGAVAQRLARIIDRARVLEDRLDAGTHRYPEQARLELHRLKVRGRLVNTSILLLTLCAMAIAVTILTLFLSETTRMQTQRVVSLSFLSGIALFVIALLAFMTETLLASAVLRFRSGPHGAPGSHDAAGASAIAAASHGAAGHPAVAAVPHGAAAHPAVAAVPQGAAAHPAVAPAAEDADGRAGR